MISTLFFTLYVFATVFWIEIHNAASVTPTAFSKLGVESLAASFMRIISLGLRSNNGMQFLAELSNVQNDMQGLCALAVLVICLATFVLLNGLTGLFGKMLISGGRKRTRKVAVNKAADRAQALIDENDIIVEEQTQAATDAAADVLKCLDSHSRLLLGLSVSMDRLSKRINSTSVLTTEREELISELEVLRRESQPKGPEWTVQDMSSLTSKRR